MKNIVIMLFMSIMLVSCSGKNNEENKVVKQLQAQKDSLEKKNKEIQKMKLFQVNLLQKLKSIYKNSIILINILLRPH